jgi:hypothetical protein
MGRCLLAAALMLLSGCITMRVGAGVSHQGDSGAPPATYDAEIGVIGPLNDEWAWSVLSVLRARGPDPENLTLLGFEAQWLSAFKGTRKDGADAGRSEPLSLLAGRVEVGRDNLGRYLGVAAVARTVFLSWDALSPMIPSISLVLNAGWYDGQVRGPSVGLSLLAGVW